MVTIDLTTPPAPTTTFLDAMARRLALTLPELRLVAELAGGAPLPFDVPGAEQPADAGSLSGRLGQSRGSSMIWSLLVPSDCSSGQRLTVPLMKPQACIASSTLSLSKSARRASQEKPLRARPSFSLP